MRSDTTTMRTRGLAASARTRSRVGEGRVDHDPIDDVDGQCDECIVVERREQGDGASGGPLPRLAHEPLQPREDRFDRVVRHLRPQPAADRGHEPVEAIRIGP